MENAGGGAGGEGAKRTVEEPTGLAALGEYDDSDGEGSGEEKKAAVVVGAGGKEAREVDGEQRDAKRARLSTD